MNAPLEKQRGGPKYRSLGTALLVLSIPCLIAGIDFQFAFPTRSCVSYDIFGSCTQWGTMYPWSGAGDLLLFFFALLVALGLFFAFWTPSPPGPRPEVRYYPVPQPVAQVPPTTTPLVVNVQSMPSQPQVFLHCRNCGSLNPAGNIHCTSCGATL